MAEYEAVSRTPLVLRRVDDSGITKKKKKKKKVHKELLEKGVFKSKQVESNVDVKPGVIIKKTPAQIAFEKMQEKRQMEKILEKASKTHKQRVEEFNRHLDSLTEHYDIPKVSWTK